MTFRGMIPPLVTPLLDGDTLDNEGLERLLRHVIDGGVDGVFMLGTTGEAPSLSYRLRREVVQRACSVVDGRVPVLVGVTDTSSVESLKMANWAADCGADAVVLALPYYFPAAQSEILYYLREITPRFPLPVMLYNMPSMTKLTLQVETARKLADIENIRGFKDSSGDIGYFGELLALKKERPDWTFLSGTEDQLVQTIRMGGDGGVNGGAMIFPQLFCDAYHAATRGEDPKADELASEIADLQAIYSVGDYASRFLRGTKCALSVLGICGDTMALPFRPFESDERKRVRRVIEKFSQAEAEAGL